MARIPFSLLEDLRGLARRLQRAAARGDRQALVFLGAAAPDAPPRRRDALAVLARLLGFRGWPQLVAIVRGIAHDDFGTLLWSERCAVHWNLWCASYDEARELRAQRGEYLLAYRRDFVVVDEHYLRTLGLDPSDPDWERIGRDWVQPTDFDARARLYRRLAALRLTEAGLSIERAPLAS